MEKDKKIKIFVIIICTGFLIGVFYHYYLGVIKGMPYPANTFLFIPADRFNDFFNTIKFTDYSPVNFTQYPVKYYGYVQTSNYFPGTFLISDLFVTINFHLIRPHDISLSLFILTIIIFILFYSWTNLNIANKNHRLISTIVFSFLTYPVLFVIDRANFEIFILIFLSLFIYLYQKGKFSLAIIPLSLAISMKLYPAVFLVLLISDRKIKQVFLTLLLSCTFIVFPLIALMKGGFYENFYKMLSVLRGYNNAVANDFGFDFGHSLYGLIKVPYLYYNWDSSSLFIIWPKIAFILMSIISLYVILIEKDFWKKIALIIMCMCLFPFVSADYKLINFFIPIFIFLNEQKLPTSNSLKKKQVQKNNPRENITYIYVVLFALLLIPKNFRYITPFSEDVFINPSIMVLITVIIIYSGTVKIKNLKEVVTRKINFLLFKSASIV